MSDAEDDTGVLLRQQTALARFGELALRSSDLDEILSEACRLVGDALGTELAKVMELLPGGKDLVVRAGVGWKPGVVGVATASASPDTSEGHALETGAPVISPDIAKEERFRYPAFLIDNDVKAMTNVVIIGGDGRPAFGILQVDSRTPRQFTDNDTAFLSTHANLIAAAVDRLRLLDEARAGETRLRSILDKQEAALETGLIGFFDWDVVGERVTADRHFARFYGLDPAALTVGVPVATFFRLVHPDDAPDFSARVEAALASTSDYAKEFRINRGDGELRWLQVRGHCIEQEGGQPRRYTGTAVDITEAKRAEAALQASEARLARLLATTPAGIVELDAAGRITYANAAAERVLGASPGTLAGVRHDDLSWAPAEPEGGPIPPDRLPAARALRGETACDAELTLDARDGRRAVVLVDAVPIRDEPTAEHPEGAVTGALAAFQDVTARHEMTQALRAGEARYRTLFEAIDAGFCIVEMKFDAAGRPVDYLFIEVNPAFEAHTGLAGAAGRSMRELNPSHEQHWFDVYGHVALTGEAARFENASASLGRWFDVRAFRTGDPAQHRVAILFNDISDRRRVEQALAEVNETLEARVAERTAQLSQAVQALHDEVVERERAEATLRQSQKLEAIGQLTGGIAHDFNNMLQAIDGSLELMQIRIGQGRAAEAERFADIARRTVTRAASLTHRLLAFARRQVLQPRPVEPDALVEGMAELIHRTVGPSITLEIVPGNGLWSVLCDPGQLESALLNLAINARDAMPEGGTLAIRTADVELSADDVAGRDGARAGEYVEFSIVDTGTGMDEATRERAFEPFFTTKPLGQGTGLGLSQLHGFAQQSGGIVRLESAPGQGTTVRLHIPRYQTVRPEDREAAEDGPAAHGGGLKGTILLVEDEPQVRAVTAEILRGAGHNVLEAEDGSAALAVLLGSRGASVDVLVTDVGLPGGLNGRQVADAARERRRGLPVLFITGYAGDAFADQLAPGMEVISKPFALAALAARVQDLLRASAPRGRA